MWPKKRVKTRLQILYLNVGTMTGKIRELAKMLERRRIDIQDTKWKRPKSREIRDGYTLVSCTGRASALGPGRPAALGPGRAGPE